MPSNQEDQDFVDFQKYGLTFKRRWLLIATIMGSVFGATGLITFSQKPVYEAEGKLLFNKQNSVSSLTGVSEQIGQLTGVTSLSNPLETEAEVIRSNDISQKTIADLQLKDEQGNLLEMDAFLGRLKVKSVRGTDILQLSYSSTNPQEAAATVNSLMRTYLENNVRTNRSEATAAREFLHKQLPEVEAKVTQAEVALRQFKEKYKVISLEEEARQGVKTLDELSNQITQLRAKSIDAKSRSSALQSQLALNTRQAVALSTLSQSNAVQQVLIEYQKVQDQLAVERSRYTDDHPAIANLLGKEQALKEQLERRVGQTVGSSQPIEEQNLQIGELQQTLTANLVETEVERLGLENQTGVLMKAFLSYQARLRNLPKLEQTQLRLERQLQVARATYEQMLKRLQEVQVVENQNVGNARIISEVLVPKKQISPRIALNLALGGVLGFILALGSALLIEAMDKSVKTAEEAKQLLDYPLLGTIPLFEQKDRIARGENKTELPVLNNPYSSVNAAFEMLQINLGFTLTGKELKVIVVSSSVVGEGKSFVAANLAVATAQMGRRVLLIDADMRRPHQHEIWEMPNLMGLSNVLVGQAELGKIAKEVLINLEVLTAGTMPPNPAALLDSQCMASLLKQAERDYDCVIIDTPPLSLLADATIVGNLADGMLVVARPGVVNSSAANTTKTMLEHSRVSVLGMVVNGVNTDKNSYEYYTNTDSGYKNSRKKEKSKYSLSKITGLRLL
ncbi:MAG: polysaccharide biosynthesis tyrosine autokinase [Cyanomargarita calcarea GSE-NOS-MK-12-04C]|jgi:capsular exopolysaccharide synthesis family protein|uniref:non-specific protein-tyrosine kinase n=1 Tax=Cyanomargarita calcarea GSE-NOS-MK-12-04C TaxID=2839659 RepID=A0A951QHH8_9CYAN|nr:polysaccharide biosynthesis tyrosine autokinase [Cyanomargarita calcarea GSE-NOS-MK-12-04C]